MNTCENCGNKHDGKYASGRFCLKKCAKGFSTKLKRTQINKKVSKKLKERKHDDIKLKCIECKIDFIVSWTKRNQKCCSVTCSAKHRSKNLDYKNKLSNSLKIAYSDIEKRKRLRDIGRKGGFGIKGKTRQGTRYQSKLEKHCFEYLEKNNIKFEPHKNIPNSAKVSDIYIRDLDLWIEIDGINREKKKEWLKSEYKYWVNKLNIYEENNLNYKVIYNLNELKQLI